MKSINYHLGIKSFTKFTSFGFCIVFLLLLNAFLAGGENPSSKVESLSTLSYSRNQLDTGTYTFQASKNSDGHDYRRHHSPVEVPSSSNEQDTKDQEESFDSYFIKCTYYFSEKTDFSANNSSWLCHDFTAFNRSRVALFKLFHSWKSFLI